MNDAFEEGGGSLSGSLILAAPTLMDPHFARSVLLLTEHGGEGAEGLILNRPLGKKLSEVLEGESFEKLAEVPLYLGGPVSTGQLTFASFHWDESRRKLDFATHLSVGQASARIAEGYDVRAFVGYSGWAGGQLEDELRNQAWISRSPVSEVVTKAGDPSALWGEVLKTMGPLYKVLADAPDDPSLN